MNVIVVDTSSWIKYFAGENNPDLELALKEARVYLPAIVVAELLSARMSEKNKSELIAFLKELPLCESTFDHFLKVGELRASLAKSGFNISTPDAHIAQCTLDLDGYLMSEDKIFEKVSKKIDLRILSNTQ